MSLHGFPALAVVKLHPVVFSILDFARVLQSLSEEVAKVVVVWCVLESKVSYVAQILVEFLGAWTSQQFALSWK